VCVGLRDGLPKNNGKRFGVIARELSSIRAVALRQGAQHSLGGHPLIEQGSFLATEKSRAPILSLALRKSGRRKTHRQTGLTPFN
jgi:hypothetical protein